MNTDLALDEMADSGLGHNRDSDCCHDFPDHLWIRHSRNTALCSDIRRDTLLKLDY